jgi:hypothetical protein
MNHPDNNEIEALLRTQFDGSVPDDGFSDRVMLQLQPRRRRTAWPLLAGMLAGIGTCWLSELSASAMTIAAVVVGMSLLTCLWTMMEADDH